MSSTVFLKCQPTTNHLNLIIQQIYCGWFASCVNLSQTEIYQLAIRRVKMDCFERILALCWLIFCKHFKLLFLTCKKQNIDSFNNKNGLVIMQFLYWYKQDFLHKYILYDCILILLLVGTVSGEGMQISIQAVASSLFMALFSSYLILLHYNDFNLLMHYVNCIYICFF